MANSKVEHDLLSVLTTHEINRVGRYKCAKELLEKLIEIHEGIMKAK